MTPVRLYTEIQAGSGETQPLLLISLLTLDPVGVFTSNVCAYIRTEGEENLMFLLNFVSLSVIV